MIEDPAPISEEAEAVLRALFATADRPAAPRALTEDELQRFAIGWVTVDEEADVLERLVHSVEARTRLIEIHRLARAGVGVRDWGFLGPAVKTSMQVYMSRTALTDRVSWPELLRRRTLEAIARLSAEWTAIERTAGAFPGWAISRSSQLLEGPETEAEEELRVYSASDPDISFALEARPRVEDGKFRVNLHLSDEDRRTVESHPIGLAISVGYEWVTLIPPQVQRPAADSLELVFDAEGVEDGEFHALSVLRVLIEG